MASGRSVLVLIQIAGNNQQLQLSIILKLLDFHNYFLKHIKKYTYKCTLKLKIYYLCARLNFKHMSEAKITSIGQTSAVGLFSITFEGDNLTEFRKFIEKFKDDAVRSKELNVILSEIGRIQKNGALERYFRYEGKMSDHVMALPVLRSGLRLYCLRMSDSVLIVGNGGVKDTRTYEQDPELNGYVINLQKLDALLRDDIQKGIVVIEATEIYGADDKTFDI